MYIISMKFVLFIFSINQIFCEDGNRFANKTYYHMNSKEQISRNILPYLVRIGYNTPQGLTWDCSGAIIHPEKILTAASCINTKPVDNISVIDVEDKKIEVNDFVTKGNIGVILIKEPIFSKNLPCLSSNIHRTSGLAAGWGALLSDTQSYSKIKKEPSSTKVEIFEIFEDTIKAHSNKRSICVVDKGGPLQLPSRSPKCLYDIVGFLNEWKDCGKDGSFGVYNIIANSIKWIEEVKY